MSELSKKLQNIFGKNRAEELGYDVWEHFVIPPFFDSLDLGVSRKPRVILGGRGCGKTMLLRYHSHYSVFSPNRQQIPSSDIERIGLYWKADTQFAKVLTKRGFSDDIWQRAFEHFIAIRLTIEILRSIKSIADSKCSILSNDCYRQIRLKSLQDFDMEVDGTIDELLQIFQSKLRKFQMWASNIRKTQEPLFLPGVSFLDAVVSELKEKIPEIKDSVFMVYIDEYENLCDYQKRTINTYLKHSEPPLIFNIAVKRNAFLDRRTLGQESISEISDFRTHDLEKYLADDFQVFAAEILMLHLSEVGNVPINVNDLRDPSALEKRRQPKYKTFVLEIAGRIFPSLSDKELAQEVFQDSSLLGKLKNEIGKALKQRSCDINVDNFICPNLPRASIVTTALLNRRNLDPHTVLEDMEKLGKGEDNRFSGSTNWIHNNFIGCLLRLYNLHSKTCPFYAGFESFIHLSRGNIRHFLELCHKSIKYARKLDSINNLTINTLDQAHAASQASAAFLGEIRSCGALGNHLHRFVLTFGSLLELAHQRPTQSEPEVCHFTIVPGAQELTDDDRDFLNEATKWSILFEEKETKVKDRLGIRSIQWVLNPIYAPYFLITYRKKRKLDLKTDQVIILIRGTNEERVNLLKDFQNRWSIDLDEISAPLFSLLKD